MNRLIVALTITFGCVVAIALFLQQYTQPGAKNDEAKTPPPPAKQPIVRTEAPPSPPPPAPIVAPIKAVFHNAATESPSPASHNPYPVAPSSSAHLHCSPARSPTYPPLHQTI